MFDFEINISDFISPSLRQQGVERTLSTLNKLAEGLWDEQRLAELSRLSTESGFELAFEEALQRGAERFVGLYLDEDEDLVEAIVDHEGFFGHEQVQKGFLSILQEPSSYLADGQEVVIYSFDRVLPRRRNRKRVNRAMSVFLSCLAQDVWDLPQLRAVYDAIFDQTSADHSALGIYDNLPQPDYERFVGRKAELAQLQKLLSPTDRHFVMTIDGIGGIGKSALALEVAHSYRRDFGKLPQTEQFEAIIWATAKHSLLTGQGIITRTQSLRTLDDIYSTIATTLEREEITRARSEEQDDIVRRALTEQRTLLIIDNLETVDDERVMSFIRDVPAPTKVIVTTRHRVDVAYPIRLVGMSQSEALELIGDESKRKRVTLTANQATRLHKRTGGVPLAIVWSVAQMGFGHGIEATLTRLGQPTSDIAQFCFQGAINLIQNTPPHHLLMALSLFATDANRDALGYVADLPLLDRDEGLEELERLSLVNKEGGRFALLPLTKVYSEEELAKEMGLEERFRERWVDFYVEFLREQSQRWYERLNSVKPEEDNILSALDWCWNSNRLDIFIFLAKKMNYYLWVTGNWNARNRYIELGLKAADYSGSKLAKAHFLRSLASMSSFRGDFDEAFDINLKSVDIYEALGCKNELAESLGRLATIQTHRKKYSAAKQILKKVTAIVKETKNIEHQVAILRRLGTIHLYEGEYNSAINLLQQARDIREENLDFRSSLSYIDRLLGIAWYMNKNYRLAREYFQQSWEMAEQIGHQPHVATAQLRLAELELTLGNLNKAMQLAHEALKVFTKLGMKRQIKDTQALLDQIAAQRKHNEL